MKRNPVPITLEVRYNTYEQWRIPVERPGVVKIYSMMGPSALHYPPGTRRKEPKSVRQAIDWAVKKDPVSTRRDEHIEILTYHFRDLSAANKVLRRLERIRQKDYDVSARVGYVISKKAIERSRRRVVA